MSERYEIGDLLGTGGMGSVYRAYDQRLGRYVALKMMKDDIAADSSARARLRAEAQMAGSLHHPGIATIYDYDEDAEGRPFISMQYVEGASLSSLVLAEGAISPSRVRGWLRDVADAVAAAHALGIVHRDLKPSNILITPAGKAVVIDFGIAVSPSREPMTETGSMLGTAEYLSPEQARGSAASAASDVYALGLVAYTCLNGTSAFRRETVVATALAQLNDPLPDFEVAVPEDLRQLVVEMTAKDPVERPSAAQVAARAVTRPRSPGTTAPVDLPPTAVLATEPTTQALGAGAPTLMAPEPVAPPTLVLDKSRTAPSWGDRVRTVPAWWWIVGAAVVAAVVLGVVLGLGGRESDVGVPDVTGLTTEQAIKRLDAAGLEARQSPVDAPNRAAGLVLAQDPQQGQRATEGSIVTIRITSGRVRISSADLLGKDADVVRSKLDKLGLVTAVQEVTSTQTAGTVVALSRSGRVEVGTTVTLSVAKAAPSPETKKGPAGPGKGPGKKPDKKPDKKPGKGRGR